MPGKKDRLNKNNIGDFYPENEELLDALKNIDTLFSQNIQAAFKQLKKSPYSKEIVSSESLTKTEANLEMTGNWMNGIYKDYKKNSAECFNRNGKFSEWIFGHIPADMFKAQAALQSMVFNIDQTIYQLTSKNDMTQPGNQAKLNELTQLKNSFSQCVEGLSDEAHVINLCYEQLKLTPVTFRTESKDGKVNLNLQPQQYQIRGYSVENLKNTVHNFTLSLGTDTSFIPDKNIRKLEEALTELENAIQNKDTTGLREKIASVETELTDFFKVIPDLGMLRDIHNVNIHKKTDPIIEKQPDESDYDFIRRKGISDYSRFIDFVNNIKDDAKYILERAEFSKKYADRLFGDLSYEIAVESGFLNSNAKSLEEYIQMRETGILNDEILPTHKRASFEFADDKNSMAMYRDIDAITENFERIIRSEEPGIQLLTKELELPNMSRELLRAYSAIKQANDAIEAGNASPDQLAPIVFCSDAAGKMLADAIDKLSGMIKPEPKEGQYDTRTAAERYQCMFLEDLKTISQELSDYKKQKLDPIINGLENGELDNAITKYSEDRFNADAQMEQYIKKLSQTVPKSPEDLKNALSPMITQLQKYVDYCDETKLFNKGYNLVDTVYYDAKNLIEGLSAKRNYNSAEFYDHIALMQHDAAGLESQVIDASYAAEHLAQGEGTPLEYNHHFAYSDHVDKFAEIHKMLETLKPMAAECNKLLKETGTFIEKTELQNGTVKHLRKFRETNIPRIEQYKDNHKNIEDKLARYREKMPFAEVVKDIPVEEMTLNNLMERAQLFKDSINKMFDLGYCNQYHDFFGYREKTSDLFNGSFNMYIAELKYCENSEDFFQPMKRNKETLIDKSDDARESLNFCREELQNNLDGIIRYINERRSSGFPGQVDLRSFESAFYNDIVDNIEQFKVVVDNLFLLENNSINKKTIKFTDSYKGFDQEKKKEVNVTLDLRKDIAPLPLTASPEKSLEKVWDSKWQSDPFHMSLYGMKLPIVTKKVGEAGLGKVLNPGWSKTRDEIVSEKISKIVKKKIPETEKALEQVSAINQSIIEEMSQLSESFGFDDNDAAFLLKNEAKIRESSILRTEVSLDMEDEEKMTHAQKAKILKDKYTQLNEELEKEKNNDKIEAAVKEHRIQLLTHDIDSVLKQIKIIETQIQFDKVINNAKEVAKKNEQVELDIEKAKEVAAKQREQALQRNKKILQIANPVKIELNAEKSAISSPAWMPPLSPSTVEFLKQLENEEFTPEKYEELIERAKEEAFGRTHWKNRPPMTPEEKEAKKKSRELARTRIIKGKPVKTWEISEEGYIEIKMAQEAAKERRKHAKFETVKDKNGQERIVITYPEEVQQNQPVNESNASQAEHPVEEAPQNPQPNQQEEHASGEIQPAVEEVQNPQPNQPVNDSNAPQVQSAVEIANAGNIEINIQPPAQPENIVNNEPEQVPPVNESNVPRAEISAQLKNKQEEIKQQLLQFKNHFTSFDKALFFAPQDIRSAAYMLSLYDVVEKGKTICKTLDSPEFPDKIESNPEEYYNGITQIQQCLNAMSPHIVDAHYAFKRFSEGFTTAANTEASGPKYTDDIPSFKKVFTSLDLLSKSVPQLTKDVTDIAHEVEDILPENSRKYSKINNYLAKSKVQSLKEKMTVNAEIVKQFREKYDFAGTTKQIDYKNLSLKQQLESQLEQLKNLHPVLTSFFDKFSTYQGLTEEKPLDAERASTLSSDYYAFVAALEAVNSIPDTNVEELQKARVKILEVGNSYYMHLDSFTSKVAEISAQPYKNDKVDANGLEDRTPAEIYFEEICNTQLQRIPNMVNNLEIIASGIISQQLGEKFDMEPKDFDHDDYELAPEHDKLFKYHLECAGKLKTLEMEKAAKLQNNPENIVQPENIQINEQNNRQPENIVNNGPVNVPPIVQPDNQNQPVNDGIAPQVQPAVEIANAGNIEINIQPVVQPIAQPVAQPENIQINNPVNINIAENPAENNQPGKPEKNPAEVESAAFKKLADELEAAKTTFNSKEYGKLITFVRALSDRKLMERGGENERKRLLAATGKAVNTYLTHKAKDGVKPNVFKKFAAVEEVSTYLDTKLKPYKKEIIDIGKGEMVNVQDLCLSYSDRRSKVIRENRGAVDKADQVFKNNKTNCQILPGSVVGDKVESAGLCLKKVLIETCQIDLRNADKMSDVVKNFTDPAFAKSELAKEQKLEKDIQAHQV